MREMLRALALLLLLCPVIPAQDTPGSKLDAELAAIKARQAAQDAKIAALEAADADNKARLGRLEGAPPGPPPAPKERRLIGGFRLAGLNFGRAPFGVDWNTRTLRAAGTGAAEILEYDLPADVPPGTDPNQWPILTPKRRIPAWWVQEPAAGGTLYISGVDYFRGKWWVTLKSNYDTSAPSIPLVLYAEDGETIRFDGRLKPFLSRQAFSGFVKRGPTQDPYVGCGGYESGQSSAAGPTLATLDGQVLIDPGVFKGPWEARTPRPPNYSGVPGQDWIALSPRGTEGRWAADRVYGGGLVLPEGVTFWPTLGTGVLDYDQQFHPRVPTDTFALPDLEKTYQYRYDATTYKLIAFAEFVGVKKIGGQELDPKGRVWVSEQKAWDFPYGHGPIVRVYE